MAQWILNYLESMDLWSWVILIICMVVAFYIFVLARRKIKTDKERKAQIKK
jgi:multidrug transporter EmrE-like cation transporter